MTSTVVDEFATGFQRTIICLHPDGTYQWERSAGPDRPAPLSAPSLATRQALEPVRTPAVSLRIPEASPHALTYIAPGPQSVARLLQSRLLPLQARSLAELLRDTGALLRRLHAHAPADAAAHPAPTGVTRLARWMENGTGPRAAALLHAEMLQWLGEHRWSRVLAWCRTTTRLSPHDVLLHGAASIGSLLPGTTPGEAVLLTGEDVTRGPATFDVGWLLGEFLELRMLAAQRQAEMPWLHDLPAALLSGYGRELDPQELGRFAVLRIMTHAHDFAAYMGWHSELAVHTSTLPRYIDTEGRAALDGTA
ncbi:phosphotransferase [Streptomyces sp. MCA2]|uniref:phosphotransferase n=1 Tax=Streptomyces sp. MCA2 TaxID=2944805 RepID=UPI00201FE9FC|nr:phosphotransferase [Streptomyces sp. MCA2]MCL7490015.1 phosphotransferase [Streptomyces sp. MCA2]